MNSNDFNDSSSNSSFGQSGQQQTGGETQDWLDKGVQSAGEKAGIDIVRVLCATYHNQDTY